MLADPTDIRIMNTFLLEQFHFQFFYSCFQLEFTGLSDNHGKFHVVPTISSLNSTNSKQFVKSNLNRITKYTEGIVNSHCTTGNQYKDKILTPSRTIQYGKAMMNTVCKSHQKQAIYTRHARLFTASQ